ncbi:MAG: M42 family metallopeptidase [Bacteroidota bacterium]
MTADDRQFLFDLLRTPSPTGWEAPGQRLWAARAATSSDRIESDAYGSAWAVREGTEGAPTVLLEAHADEIGFAIKYITEAGYLRIDRIGGSDHAIARGRRLTLLGDNGPVPGIIGNTAIHLRDRKGEEKAPKLEDLFVDVGASSRDEVAALGLRVGHPAVYPDGPEMLGDSRVTGRALDNRLGGFVLTQVLARLAEAEPHPATTIALNAVQEEIGGNGAKMAAYRLAPDVAVVLDVTHATDSPGIEKAKHGEVVLGGGPTVTHGTVNHPTVVQRLVEVAEAEGVTLQHESSSRYSGTDTDVIFTTRRGIPSALVSIPMRYMHSTVETVDLADVEATVTLLTAFVQSVRADDLFRTPIL